MYLGINEEDVVGIFTHQNINADVLTIREHKAEIDGKRSIMYSVKTDVSFVVFVGFMSVLFRLKQIMSFKLVQN